MLDAKTLFQESYYLAKNSEIADAVTKGIFQNGFEHFTKFGQFEGRNPSALFDSNYYLANNPDVLIAVNSKATTALQHFINFGEAEGRNPSPFYNNSYYLGKNPDVAAAVDRDELTGLSHFIQFGELENRSPSPLYNDSYYLAKNPGVAAAVASDQLTGGTEHFIKFGAAEGREVTPFIKSGDSTLPNGVAAGDTTQTSTVLWARSTLIGNVVFEFSTDPNFSNSLGTLTKAVTDVSVPVKAELTNLKPGTQYFYRVRNGIDSEVGQFRTAAELGNSKGLRFGVAGDWQGQLTPFPAISNAPERNLDFFVRIGDSAYVDDLSPDLPGVRQPKNLAEFSTKYNEVYGQRYGLNTWADLQASTSIYSTWDDHELTNDFAGGAMPTESPQKEGIFGTGGGFVNDTPVFDDALKAFQAYNPVRDDFYGNTGDSRTANEQKLYRYNTFGSDAATFVLDLRSFRDNSLKSIAETSDQATVNKFLNDAFTPNRTMLGGVQLQDLKNDLLKAQQNGVTWKFIMSSDPIQNFGIPVAGDRWEGYAAERTDLLRFIKENNIKNVVFATGDFHGYVVNNVTYQDSPGQPQIPTDVIDVMTSPVAIQLNIGQGPFAAPFGPATVAFTPTSLLPQSEKDRYNSLPTREEKDAFIRNILDQRTAPLGYDPVGLEGSGIDARLIQGQYLGVHTYGWNEFEIAPGSQELKVTTYGIEPYTQSQLDANPSAIINRKPFIVSQFVVNPK